MRRKSKLYASERHVPIAGRPWDEERARAAIVEIVADAEASFRGEELWPCHPLETFHGNHKSMYWGAAGVIWALHRLAAAGAARSVRDYSALASRLHRAYLADPGVGFTPVYMIGESGVLLVEWMLAPSTSALERLHAAIEASLKRYPELCHGAAGSIVAANVVYRTTKGSEWRALLQRHVDQLWSEWNYSPDAQCHLWQIRGRVGGPTKHLGACHGLAGNAMALMQVIDRLSPSDRKELYARCVAAYHSTAIVEQGCANWYRSVGDPGWGENQLLVQWCYGAPGMVTAMKNFPSGDDMGASPRMDTLLRKAAELTWHAGALAKGPSLCHGTAGNGYAFLAMFERTGERIWLERARTFAMHAIAQSQEMRSEYGRGRYSLWTGDIGVALYVWQCIQGSAGVPTLDYL